MIEIEFHGAAKTVTGSNYLIKTSKNQFIVDCGMFQGPDVESKNIIPYEYDASKVDFVLLTHAHIDHCGMLPKLFKGGFRGKIYSTHHTMQISSLLLLDSAKIQESNYSMGKNYGKYTNEMYMVYGTKDAEETINLCRVVNFDEEFSPVEGIKVKFIRAGHILGAASIEVEITDEGETKTILFSGDIGRVEKALIETFDVNYKSTPDYILMESLYGGQIHPDKHESAKELVKIINETVAGGGNVFVPSFAVQRTQEILQELKFAMDDKSLDKRIPVWLDSPLAQRVTQIYIAALQDTPESIFEFDSLRYVKKYRESLKLAKQSGQVIIAGSGMADGGRIVEHLAYGLAKKNNSVVFVGYQAEGTLGRQLVEGAKSVEIDGTKIEVKAKIHYLHGFSAHGDTNDYLTWIKRHLNEKLAKVFLIHAEPDRAEAMKAELAKINVNQTYVPEWREKVMLSGK